MRKESVSVSNNIGFYSLKIIGIELLEWGTKNLEEKEYFKILILN